MDKQRIFTLTEVAQHKSKKDCWLVIHGRVVNVTKFLEQHPGGDDVLMESAGKDATKEFEDIGHSRAAKKLLRDYQVGFLQGYKIVQEEEDADEVAPNKSKRKEVKAFVIDDDSQPNHEFFIDFLPPLIVACSYLAYRYLTGAAQFTS
ncbi:uncharacterized protein LOC127807302 [Diospyros lotus]|uniref:uncharacterized protein LOC127807302 n=1 Tax=Diospyros lotus TaxID=55363 RepID=UPI0022585470|nr:uncharacterized protein LOC127807302 [Diospyros lotus]